MEFKDRVRKSIIKGAYVYKDVFIDYEYLIYSSNFQNSPYYIISAAENNYPHLTGVNPLLPAQEFYTKCLNSTLRETDFDFSSKYNNEKEVKGSVRRKIQMLPMLATLFTSDLQAEEDFSKGNIHCSLATTDNTLTLGFVSSMLLRPKTLLKKNQLNLKNAVDVTLILRRNRGSMKFDTIVQSDVQRFRNNYPDIVDIRQVL